MHEQAVAYLVLSVLPLKLYGASCGVHVSTRLNIWQFLGRSVPMSGTGTRAKACEKWCQFEHDSLYSNLQHRRVVLGKHSSVFEHHVSCNKRTSAASGPSHPGEVINLGKISFLSYPITTRNSYYYHTFL